MLWTGVFTVPFFTELIYARLTVRRILFCSIHLLPGLALKQQLLFLFGCFVASVFVSGCIQKFTSASRRCRFHCHQPLHHSFRFLVARRGLSFAHFCFSRRRLPFSRLLCLPVAVVGFLVVLLFRHRPLIPHSFTSASRWHVTR